MPTAGAAALDRIFRRRWSLHLAFSSAVMWFTLGGRSLARAASQLADAVDRGSIDEARRLAPTLVGRDTADLDEPALYRAGVESVAENTVDAVVGPLLWYAIAGPTGAVAYRAANTLDAMVGHRNDRYECFGWASAKLDDVLTWPAARLAALAGLIAEAAAPFFGKRLGGPYR